MQQNISWGRIVLLYLQRRKVCVMINCLDVWILCHWQVISAHYYNVCSVHLFLQVKKKPVQVVPSSCDLWDRVRLPVSTAPTLAGQWFCPLLCCELQFCKVGNLYICSFFVILKIDPNIIVRVRIKLFLFIPLWHREGVELQLYLFLAAALCGVETSASCPTVLPLGKGK
jgi:hypothetical protein